MKTSTTWLTTIIVTVITLGLGCVDREFKVDQQEVEVKLQVPSTNHPLRHQRVVQTVRLTVSKFNQYNNTFNVKIGKNKLPTWLRVEPQQTTTITKNNTSYALVNIVTDLDKCKDTKPLLASFFTVPVIFTNDRGFKETTTLNIQFLQDSKEEPVSFAIDWQQTLNNEEFFLTLKTRWTKGGNSESTKEPVLMKLIIPKEVSQKINVKFDKLIVSELETSIETKPDNRHVLTVKKIENTTNDTSDSFFFIEVSWHGKIKTIKITPNKKDIKVIDSITADTI
jgi:hypothetical protein